MEGWFVSDALQAYFTAAESLQTERLIVCFARNARVEDPAGDPPVVGHDQLVRFFDNRHKRWKHLSLTPLLTVTSNAKAIVNLAIEIISDFGEADHFDVISTFRFRVDGKIQEMLVEFEADDMTRLR